MATEKRLIDANAMREDWLENGENEYVYDTNAVLASIDAQPTVDAVEVVRCKYCKHWHEETGWCNHHSHFIGENGEACHPWENCDWKMLNPEDFCSYGERKNDR